MRIGKSIIFFFLLLLVSRENLAQTNFLKFKIPQSGIYKITSAQANQLGIPLEQLAFFGYPGMLPQQLDSTNLTLREIPSLLNGQELWIYLEGPHQITPNENGQIQYTHHLFEDSLSYLIGRQSSPKRIQEQTLSNSGMIEPGDWYQWRALKGEDVNVLNSGRTWFSNPIRAGQSLNFSLGLSSAEPKPWILTGNLMAQSFSNATMRILTGNELLAEIAFDPIPNTTYGIKGQERIFQTEFSPSSGNLSQIRFTFQGQGGNSAGHLNHMLIGMPVSSENPTFGLIINHQTGKINVASDRLAWEVSDFFNPKSTNSLAEPVGNRFFIFSPAEIASISSLEPAKISARISNNEPQFLIITHPSLRSAALKLQQHKTSLGISSSLLTTEEIYDSFGYGNADLSAIRNAIAFHYHQGKNLKNVLLIGKGTFDYKGKLGGRPNLIPIYTSRNSLNPLQTYSSDDYLGLIDWGQGIWEESREGDEHLQIGIGRIPAINFAEANLMVEKIIDYENRQFDLSIFPSFTLFADDADNNIHMRDSESHATFLNQNHPEIKTEKLYLDAFEQISVGGQQQSPEAKKALENQLQRGALVVNYVGHGNETTLTAEEVFTVSDISDWAKQNPLALWVTATCEFGRHDSPFLRSGAEELLFTADKGAIGLLTTGRPVFSSVNFQLNEAFVKEVFQKVDQQNRDLGTVFRLTKNQSQNGVLNRNFSLLGDPSMKLALPELGIQIKKLFQSGATADTLLALEEIELEAEIVDPVSGAMMSSFDGEYILELRASPTPSQTLGDENSPFDYSEENSSLFRGRGKVENGVLKSTFLIPNQLSESVEKGNLRLLAWDELSGYRALGQANPTLSQNPTPPADQTGPEIKPSIEGQSAGSFVFNSTQLEISAELLDVSGIQVSGKLPGQDLFLQVNDLEPVILNEEFFAKDGNYQSGTFKVAVDGFQEGINLLKIGAWDNVGNGSLATLTVEIRGSAQLKILDHVVFPNPATVESDFILRHNRPGENILVHMEVFSMDGKILFSDSRRFVRAENPIEELTWIFFQNPGKYPVKGTYIYRLSLTSEQDNSSDSVSGKILIR